MAFRVLTTRKDTLPPETEFSHRGTESTEIDFFIQGSEALGFAAFLFNTAPNRISGLCGLRASVRNIPNPPGFGPRYIFVKCPRFPGGVYFDETFVPVSG